ncbi:MAG: alpha-glucuronidase [Tannerella sp.]|jgi:alpha-glucuronidase|nr:alpha-glucuronidase [Tannerella sp.]
MKTKFILKILFLFICGLGYAEDGSRLWLPVERHLNSSVTANKKNETIEIAVNELKTQWQGETVRLELVNAKKSGASGDSYLIFKNKKNEIIVQSSSSAGLLYGAYRLLRLQKTGGDIPDNITINESPAYDLRILNHWDNLNGTVERGYAGHSLWQWDELPAIVSPRYKEYARANASIGINGTVLNNVNASPDILKTDYLQKIKVLADIFRPYGIKVYLSINFSSPKIIGGLPTSDPLDNQAINWWKAKTKEIYALIPDFGGFLVKANSEGQPGPQDFGRTHAEGANMLADALKLFGGIVMWRAFVYSAGNEDRAKQAYNEFVPLDGQFADNVIVQVKNGPIDFQPREPFNALFGAMKKTALMPELQITQEYLGQGNHLVFLAQMWKEFFESDTYVSGVGSTIAKVTDGTFIPQKITAIAGVANIGSDANWTGHIFGQANWYAFGRLAWNPEISTEQIADEWIKQTFTTDENFVAPVKKMMIDSWEACVNYMMPLGLHHIFAWGHHYGPEPWCDIPGARPDWLPPYYHRADNIGLGFDRTTTGSNAVSQYQSPMNEEFNNIETCPEKFLLWFHHVPWNYKMKNGRIMWDELCFRYDTGVRQVREMQKTWDIIEQYIDRERFNSVQSKLKIQARDAVWWKDACLLYFQTFSKEPIPYDIERPVHELDDLKKIKLDLEHHN